MTLYLFLANMLKEFRFEAAGGPDSVDLTAKELSLVLEPMPSQVKIFSRRNKNGRS